VHYTASIDYLFGLQRFGIKLGLQNITQLLKHLGNPHRRLNCIHVAGSNGKGSTCALLHAILEEAGYKTGLYTSPHLSDFTERIQIGSKPIARHRVAELTGVLKKICEQKGLTAITFFEFVTSMAFLYFYEEKADPVVVETGLGGTYDATNVIHPLVSIITTISLEHQQYLGKTLPAIAREKAGIIKPETPLLTGVRNLSLKRLFMRLCHTARSPFYSIGNDLRCKKENNNTFSYNGLTLKLKNLRCGLVGDHQMRNSSLAIAAAELLAFRGYALAPEHIRAGVARVRWPGRMEILQQQPMVMVDGAHNPDGWRMLRKAIAVHFRFRRLFLILGAMQDKDIQAMLKILTPGAYAIILCRPNMTRAASKKIFENFIRFSDSKRVFWLQNSGNALRYALSQANPDDLICAAGSLFLAGEIRQRYRRGTLKPSGRIGL